MVRHALAELALVAALTSRMLAGRWPTVWVALDHGATDDQVARAMDLDTDEVAHGLRRHPRPTAADDD